MFKNAEMHFSRGDTVAVIKSLWKHVILTWRSLESIYFLTLIMSSLLTVTLSFDLICQCPSFDHLNVYYTLSTNLSLPLFLSCLSPHFYFTRAIVVFCLRLDSLPYAVCFCTLHTLYWHLKVSQRCVALRSCSNSISGFLCKHLGLCPDSDENSSTF